MKETYTDEETFGLLRTYIKQKALLTASIASDGEQKQDTGLVAGHAYSILDAKRFPSAKVSLLQLRNPWGSFEWKGAWSDNAPEWDKHPTIKKLCNHVSADDGTFWISLEDFVEQFNNVDVCQRSKGVHDLYIDLHEGDGCLDQCMGPIMGCWDTCRSGEMPSRSSIQRRHGLPLPVWCMVSFRYTPCVYNGVTPCVCNFMSSSCVGSSPAIVCDRSGYSRMSSI